MRIHATWLILAMALAGCAKANAATVDPNNDFDCGVTTGFFREVARMKGDTPDDNRQKLYVLYGWYAAKWNHDHPGGKTAELRQHEIAMVTAMGKDPHAYRDAGQALISCTDRATADPKFDRFARYVQQHDPNAR